MKTKTAIARPDVDQKILHEGEGKDAPSFLQVARGVMGGFGNHPGFGGIDPRAKIDDGLGKTFD
jgi:hypothetical protein